MTRAQRCLASFLFVAATGCATVSLGRQFAADPRTTVKVGLHSKQDIVAAVGPPVRTFLDSRGREVFTYLWADGRGAGEKCLIAFNENAIVYLVECTP